VSGLTDSEHALVVAGIAAGASLLVAFLAALFAYLATKRDRRRVLYGEALRAALTWQEMVYRVRRRRDGAESALMERFHDMHDQLAYYQGWIGSESKYMERSYRRLVSRIKSGTEPLITAAWGESIRPLPANSNESDQHEDFRPDVERFLNDVRSHLSPLPWRKLAAVARNRTGAP